MAKRPVKKTVDELQKPAAKPKAPAPLSFLEPTAEPIMNSAKSDKYIYLWAVALIAFSIGLLTGYGIGFKRYAPELIDQYLVTNNAGTAVRLERLKETADKLKNLVPPPPPSDDGLTPAPPAEEEAGKIDAWLKAQNLNSYGDPPDTVYAGGTPLFNEAAGETTDRVAYLKAKFPNQPWLTNQ